MDISTFPSSVVRADNFANSANPSCTLPSELLASIFLIHRDNSLNLFEASLSGHASLHLDLLLLKGPIVRMIPWLWPSHCCRAWRTVALSTPTLWDTFSLRNTSCTTELLRRSGTGVLLHLSLPFDAGASGCSSLALVLNTASAARVRKLELNLSALNACRSGDIVSLTSGLSRLPELHELEIRGGLGTDATPNPDSQKRIYSALQKLIAGEWLLRLNIFLIPRSIWKSTILAPWLTHLSVMAEEGDTWSVQNLLFLLGQVTHLQYLDVCGLVSLGNPSIFDPLSLPSLATVNMAATTEAFHAFFTAVRVPMTARLRLVAIRPLPTNPAQVTGLLTLLLPRIQNVKTFFIGIGVDETRFVFSHSKELHEHPTRDDEEMSSAFRKWCPPPENFPASAFLNMSLLHPPAEVNNDLFLLPLRDILNQVEHIGMRTLHHVDFDDVMHKFMRWLHLFGSLYSVQIVNIRLNSIPSAILLDILHPKSDGTLPFPALRSLVLPYFDLEIAIGQHELMNTFNARAMEQLHAWDRNFNVLGRALQARNMLQKPLSQLVLHECSGASTKTVISMLQRAVKELVVTWNAEDSDMEMGELEIDIFGEGIVSSQVSFVPQDDF